MKRSTNSAYKKLRIEFKKMGSVVVAYSGGVDSTLLLRVAKEVLNDRILAVTAISQTYPEEELKDAKKMAKKLNVKHKIVKTDEASDPNFIKNPPTRCYYCKKELFSKLKKIAKNEGLNFVVDGANKDDIKDFRPGLRAAEELSIRSPLKEVGFTKSMIRELSKALKLPTHGKPALACLASRIPYGRKISKELLKRIGDLEKYLKRFGLTQLRLRHHDHLVRIEVPQEEFPIILRYKSRIIKRFKKAGYKYITIDLEGFRSGSMNLMLDT